MAFKVIFFLDDYLPNCTQIHARMMHDLAIEFTKLGIKVVILTPGGPKLHKKLEIKNLENVEIWRFKSLPTRGQSHIKRLIGEKYNIQHISINDVGSGYDIQSWDIIDKNIVKIYIEVKAIKNCNKRKFYWSENEMNVAKKLKDK